MSSLFAQFATNRRAEAEGVLVSFGGKTQFRIARRSKANKRYTAMLDREIKPHSHAVRAETLSPELDDEIMMRVFCHTILLDWQHVAEPKVFGTEDEVPYTPENGIKLMTALPELYAELNANSAKMSLFREEEREQDAKN